jgi:hypothetical protein
MQVERISCLRGGRVAMCWMINGMRDRRTDSGVHGRYIRVILDGTRRPSTSRRSPGFGGMGKPVNLNGFCDHFPIIITIHDVNKIKWPVVATPSVKILRESADSQEDRQDRTVG